MVETATAEAVPPPPEGGRQICALRDPHVEFPALPIVHVSGGATWHSNTQVRVPSAPAGAQRGAGVRAQVELPTNVGQFVLQAVTHSAFEVHAVARGTVQLYKQIPVSAPSEGVDPALGVVPPPIVPPVAPVDAVSSVQFTAVGLVPLVPQRASQLGAQLVQAGTASVAAAAPRQVQLQFTANAEFITPKENTSENRAPHATFID